MGRPTDYNIDIATRICELLGTGMSVRKISMMDGFPSSDTIYKWLARHDLFAEMYARAREQWADAQFELLIEISEDSSKDTYEDEDGKTRTDHEVVARSKLRIDTLKWALAKMFPRKYGERLTEDINIRTADSNLTDEQRAARIQAIFARAMKRKPLTIENADISDLV